ncbi:MAG TPA: alpha/beta hydrolase [Solirubrobacteraceae bacterium]
MRGTMLTIHGGGWRSPRGDARRTLASTALTLMAGGWRVVNIDYTPGAGDPLPMLRDVVAFYDQARKAFGGTICAYGESAGGHLAAMLALERPSLTCAVLAAAPTDLPELARTAIPELRRELRRTFGTDPATLEQWSPARLWNAGSGPALFATAADNDRTVPPRQLEALAAAEPDADTEVLPGAAPGSAGAVAWMHSAVRNDALQSRFASLGRWLDGIAPRDGEPTGGKDAGRDCSALRDRAQLLRAGEAWQQGLTTGQAVIATRGCSGAGRWQDDGLSVWAFPSGTTAANGAQATLTLDPGRTLRSIDVALRGFLARPQEWDVGLYASTATRGEIDTPVATCERARCTRLRLVRTRAGSLITLSGSAENPDAGDAPPTGSFRLATGTRRLQWRLRCVAPSGCSLAAAANRRGVSLRPRDPLGHPAILSVYRVALT